MRNRGFTLIEILVVLAIIGLISATVLPSLTSYFQVSLQSAAREIASTVKETYNSTIVSGKVHRIVYDLKENQYWVESGPPTALLETRGSKEREERRKKFEKNAESPPASPFVLEKAVTRKKQSLPRGVIFEDVVTQQSPEPISEGLAYSYLFPHGITERTVIHLTDSSKHHASLVVSPILGRTDVYERYITNADLAAKP